LTCPPKKRASSNPLANPHGLAIDVANGKLFWAEASDVKTASLDGTLQMTVVAGAAASAPSALAVDPKAKRLYWTDTGLDAVRAAPYTGAPVQTLFSGGEDPTGIAVDPGP
jgi:DNA-binding beta-propeller fold protein YncE